MIKLGCFVVAREKNGIVIHSHFRGGEVLQVSSVKLKHAKRESEGLITGFLESYAVGPSGRVCYPDSLIFEEFPEYQDKDKTGFLGQFKTNDTIEIVQIESMREKLLFSGVMVLEPAKVEKPQLIGRFYDLLLKLRNDRDATRVYNMVDHWENSSEFFWLMKNTRPDLFDGVFGSPRWSY